MANLSAKLKNIIKFLNQRKDIIKVITIVWHQIRITMIEMINPIKEYR